MRPLSPSQMGSTGYNPIKETIIDLTLDSESDEEMQDQSSTQVDSLLSLFKETKQSETRGLKRKSPHGPETDHLTVKHELSPIPQRFKSPPARSIREERPPSAVPRHQYPAAALVRDTILPAVSDKIRPEPKRWSTPRAHSITPPIKLPGVSVVIPTSPGRTHQPSARGQRVLRQDTPSTRESSSDRSSQPTGLSTKYYPVNAHKIHAKKGAYPHPRQTAPDSLSVAVNSKKGRKGNHRSSQSKWNDLHKALVEKLAAIPGPPVTLDVEWDAKIENLASNFQFISSYKLQKGVKRVDDSFNAGCDCGPSCDPNRCSCLSQEIDSEDLMVPYKIAGMQLVLSRDFLKKKSMIYECSSHCSCSKDCWNRVVQHGRTVPLEIFQTTNRGFGLRSADYIQAGRFIDCYLGEVITRDEADLREDAAGFGSGASPSYLFSLDFLPNEDRDEDENDEEPDFYVVDGQRLGGLTRFMNHSCNPNCKMIPVSTNHGDSRIYELAFFALRDIEPQTELTFDYNPNWNGDKRIDPTAVKCLCGEAKCRGQLWPNQRKSTKEE